MSTVDTKALRALREKATQGEWRISDEDSGRYIFPMVWKGQRNTNDLALIARFSPWAGASQDDRKAVMAEAKANAELAVALVNAAPALLDELDMRRQQVLDLGEDLNGVELRAETAEAECERLREATRAVCESTDASAVQLGLRMLRAALAPQEPSTTSTPPTPGGAHTQD